MSAPVTEPVVTPAAPTTPVPVDPAATAEVIEGAEALGDPGKKALDAMKAERNAAKAAAATLQAQLDDMKAKAEGREAERAAEVAAQKVKDEALSVANQRIVKANLRAVATGKLADPSDAQLYIDLSKFDVSDDGEVDEAALTAAVEDLVKRKPHLAAQGGPATVITSPTSTREGPGATQEQQIIAAIAAATAAGKHAEAIALKRQLSALHNKTN